MQGMASDKTFHLKWNNHLQNLSQLFTTIYSSSALADVTLSCRDGTLKAHKLVLSACSPYFEQIFKDNPCQHPIVILKGIPFSEINLLVEFMYKGSVDVQEMDLQSLMHTASELEIRGLAYEARDSAAQMLNVNLEYPAAYTNHPIQAQSSYTAGRTDVERLKQIHMYQQSMMRAEELRKRRRDDTTGTNTAVNNILAAAAREMEEARRVTITSDHDGQPNVNQSQTSTEKSTDMKRDDEPRKRPSIMSPDDDKLRVKKKAMTVRFQEDSIKTDERPPKLTSPGLIINEAMRNDDHKMGGIKVVQLSALQKPTNNEHDDSDEKRGDEDEETDSSESMSDSAGGPEVREARRHQCDICEQRFSRSSHLSRHRLTHTGERPYTCGGCGRSFARSDKLRLHTNICEKEDPTVDMKEAFANREAGAGASAEVMSGMVRTTHRESGHLVFTAGGDVMLPRQASLLLAGLDGASASASAKGDLQDLPRRGRGRPRKTPLPLTPKIKKRRGRPPKTSLDMEGCVLTGGSLVGPSPGVSLSAVGQQLLMKKKRGRPPKYLMGDGRPNENYNATNLPFGDFSYLTEMMYNPAALAYGYVNTLERNDQSDGNDHTNPGDMSQDRAIDLSDSYSEDEDSSRIELEENVPPVAMETQIMTVGDCQIVKLAPNGDEASDKTDQIQESVPTSTTTSSSLTITPITTVGDCTIRPVDSNT